MHADHGSPTAVTEVVKITTSVYLNFDPVLHDKRIFFYLRRGIFLTAPGRSRAEWMPNLDTLLAPLPDIRIELSADWVRVRRVCFVKKHSSPTLQGRVIGATYGHCRVQPAKFALMPRGAQIARNAKQRGPASWFAIDENTIRWPTWSGQNLVQASGEARHRRACHQEAIKEMLKRYQTGISCGQGLLESVG